MFKIGVLNEVLLHMVDDMVRFFTWEQSLELHCSKLTTIKGSTWPTIAVVIASSLTKPLLPVT